MCLVWSCYKKEVCALVWLIALRNAGVIHHFVAIVCVEPVATFRHEEAVAFSFLVV